MARCLKYISSGDSTLQDSIMSHKGGLSFENMPITAICLSIFHVEDVTVNKHLPRQILKQAKQLINGVMWIKSSSVCLSKGVATIRS